MAKIGVVGYGYVGKSIVEFLSLGKHEITIYDSASSQLSDVGNLRFRPNIESLDGCDFVFICVPTPQKDDGSCDTSIVEDSVLKINKFKSETIIVIKSTVPPLTCSYLDSMIKYGLVFCPEFAGENKYHTEHKFLKSLVEMPFFIFGGDDYYTEKVIDLYQKIGGPDKKYIKTTYEVAELTKYVNNSFFALKVAFCNELYNLCEALGISYNEVRELWHLDPRNNRSFTSVFPNERGFGGKCFPKDISALINTAGKNGVDLSILKAAVESNSKLIKENNS